MKLLATLIGLSALLAFVYIGVLSALYLINLDNYTATDYMLSLFLTFTIGKVMTKHS